VIVNGLRKAENTAVAIEARGFGEYPERTYWKEFHWTRSGLLLMSAFTVFCVALIVWERFFLSS
jgi:energy-coupling factor transporter transmembrane protein EcfT